MGWRCFFGPSHGGALLAGLALTLAALSTACSDRVSPGQAVETPERQFTLFGVRIEERKGDRLLWSGKAKRADGDLSDTDLTTVVLTRMPQDQGQPLYTMYAPRATLSFKDQTGVFDEVRVVDPKGAELRAGTAEYDEKKGRILLRGPLHFTAKGLKAEASSGVVRLDDGSMIIDGPVRGRFRAEPSR